MINSKQANPLYNFLTVDVGVSLSVANSISTAKQYFISVYIYNLEGMGHTKEESEKLQSASTDIFSHLLNILKCHDSIHSIHSSAASENTYSTEYQKVKNMLTQRCRWTMSHLLLCILCQHHLFLVETVSISIKSINNILHWKNATIKGQSKTKHLTLISQHLTTNVWNHSIQVPWWTIFSEPPLMKSTS